VENSFRYPVNPTNPGQVLACLGLMEAAQVLLGASDCRFTWDFGDTCHFELFCSSNPMEATLDFLIRAKMEMLKPQGYTEENASGASESETFPARQGDKMGLPIRLTLGNQSVEISHWTDELRRDSFKLYAGNRTAYGIANNMLNGVVKSAKKIPVEYSTLGIRQLREGRTADFLRDPFNTLTPIGGSFNFDPRGAWTAIDTGYSPNDQKHLVSSSPFVELLSAWGLQWNRPKETEQVRSYRYWLWEEALPPNLARATFSGSLPDFGTKTFQFQLALAGKNKVVNYAEEKR
jgi:CRISPR-associated protein Csb3